MYGSRRINPDATAGFPLALVPNPDRRSFPFPLSGRRLIETKPLTTHSRIDLAIRWRA